MEIISNNKTNIEVLADPESLARRSVDIFICDAREAVKAKDKFSVALSGGNTPARFLELLGQNPEVKTLPWDKIHIFWVDERCVPAYSQWSNYGLASDTFLSKVEIPEKNIHRVPTEYDDCKKIVESYEQEIMDVFDLHKGQIPEFDLVVLGLGEDGHIGSLFADDYALFNSEDLACVVYSLDEKLSRVTLTCPVICAGSDLVVLVSGERKAEILKEVFSSEPDEVHYSAHLLWPVLDKVTWLVDSEAAKLL